MQKKTRALVEEEGEEWFAKEVSGVPMSFFHHNAIRPIAAAMTAMVSVTIMLILVILFVVAALAPYTYFVVDFQHFFSSFSNAAQDIAMPGQLREKSSHSTRHGPPSGPESPPRHFG